jgi:hypothetical protein
MKTDSGASIKTLFMQHGNWPHVFKKNHRLIRVKHLEFSMTKTV